MFDLLEENGGRFGADGDGKDHTINGAPEVGIVVDVIAAAFIHVDRLGQEEDHEKDRRHFYPPEPKGFPGVDEDKGELHSDDGAGGAQTAVVVVVVAFNVGRDIGYDDSRDIEDEKIVML